MKVILLKDVKKVGKKDQIIEVSDGYGRNYLIPNKLAVMATNKSEQVLEDQKAKAAQLDKQNEAAAKELAEKLKNMPVVFRVKAGKEGRIYGSVSTKQIVEQFQKDYNIKLDKRKFIDTNPVSGLGTTNLKIELYKNVIGTVIVRLIEE